MTIPWCGGRDIVSADDKNQVGVASLKPDLPNRVALGPEGIPLSRVKRSMPQTLVIFWALSHIKGGCCRVRSGSTSILRVAVTYFKVTADKA